MNLLLIRMIFEYYHNDLCSNYVKKQDILSLLDRINRFYIRYVTFT